MNSRPLIGKEWNERFQITNGQEIVDFLRPVHEQGITLRPPIADLTERVSAAWERLTARLPQKITILSLQEVEDDIVHLPQLLQDAMGLGLEQIIERDMDDIFKSQFSGEEEQALSYALQRNLDSAFQDSLPEIRTDPFPGILKRTVVREEVGQLLKAGVLTTLYYHIGLLIVGRSEDVARVAPFTELSVIVGNPVVADLGDSDILVITA